MAVSFVKGTYKNRAVEFPGRRRETATKQANVFDYTREEGTIFEAGTPFNKATMDDLETRIQNAFDDVDVQIGSIFASIDRRITETWNDDLEFAVWALSNVGIYNNSLILGNVELAAKTLSGPSYDLAVDEWRGVGIKVTFTKSGIISAIGYRTDSDGTKLINPELQLVDAATRQVLFKMDLQYNSSGVVYPNWPIEAKSYYVDIHSKTDPTSNFGIKGYTLTYPQTYGFMTFDNTYNSRAEDFTSVSLRSGRTYGVVRIDAKSVDNTGVTTGTAESPLVDSQGIFNYDLIDYLIDANDGTYQVDLLDSVGSVVLANVTAKQMITELPVQDLKIRITLNRPADTDISPEVKAVAIAYIK